MRVRTERPGDPRLDKPGMTAAPPVYRIDPQQNLLEPRLLLSPKDWDGIFAVMKELRISGLNAGGQMTDAVMARLPELDQLTRLHLGGSRRLGNEGLAFLAGMPQIEELDLGDHPGGRITDRGLQVLGQLPNLRKVALCWQRGITDAGVAHLARCDHLESVDLLGTRTGDGAIAALTSKPHLRRFKTGRLVTDAGLVQLHEFPAFKSWAGGEVSYALMSPDAGPTHLLVDGPFTNQGFAQLVGLDGLFGLSIFWHAAAMTADALAALPELPRLGFLGCEGQLCNDVAMGHIAALPALRMLMAQGTVASDDGFTVLSRSSTLEHLWGRECPNLTGSGFAALSAMPTLRGLAVSCRGVDHAALAALPSFPALRQLMPMDVPDGGFRHVGRCAQLEDLWCMYCRDTTDAATEHLTGLQRLKSYYAGKTQITDRSLEILGQLTALESIELWACSGITDAGLANLVRLPRLRQLSVSGSPQVSANGVASFPVQVRVSHEG